MLSKRGFFRTSRGSAIYEVKDLSLVLRGLFKSEDPRKIVAGLPI
jgi:hypothetical protein